MVVALGMAPPTVAQQRVEPNEEAYTMKTESEACCREKVAESEEMWLFFGGGEAAEN